MQIPPIYSVVEQLLLKNLHLKYFQMNSIKTSKPIFKYLALLGLGFLLFIILKSAILKTLVPFYRNGEYEEFAYNLIGIPILLFGTGIFAYGGWLFYNDTRSIMDDDKLLNNVETIRNKGALQEDRKKARIENTKVLFAIWKRGSIRLLIGALIIICGGIIINLKKIIG